MCLDQHAFYCTWCGNPFEDRQSGGFDPPVCADDLSPGELLAVLANDPVFVRDKSVLLDIYKKVATAPSGGLQMDEACASVEDAAAVVCNKGSRLG